MYSFFTKMFLLGCILLCFSILVLTVIGRRPHTKVWKYIFISLGVVIISAVIGMIAT